MYSNLLALADWPQGLFTFLLGMVVIFFGMTVIVFFVSMVGKVINKPAPKEEKKVEVQPVEEVILPTAVEDGEIPEDIKVAIIAAIAAYYDNTPQANHEFKVRKIKKLRN